MSNTEGSANTADGALALSSNTTGGFNTGIGYNALGQNTTGSENTANGAQALYGNTEGGANTATGSGALALNITGSENTANGNQALFDNTGGYRNTATGTGALLNNVSGFLNTGNGYRALANNTGSGNTALGYLAGQNLTIGDDNICIGNDGVAGEGGTIRIGRSFIGATYIAGIFGQTAPGGATVFVTADGKLGTNTSSARFKAEIKPMDTDSEGILALRPVSFRYKEEIDPQGMPQFGLVAEDVEKVNPHLVIRDTEGKPHTVRYEQINAMLLNEFLKEHKAFAEEQRKVQEQEATIADLKKGMTTLTVRLEKQGLQIQKVSAQIEANKAAPRVAGNNH